MTAISGLLGGASGTPKAIKYTSNDTFTNSASTPQVVLVSGAAGGGSGGCGGNTNPGTGGGAGESIRRFPVYLAASESVSITVGAGGTGVIGATATAGNDGADTVFGDHFTLEKGLKGGVSAGGTGGGDDDNVNSFAGANGSSSQQAGLDVSIFSGGASGTGKGGGGGASGFADGGDGGDGGDGEAGSMGSGGGGSDAGYTSGDGGDGFIVIEYIDYGD